jgi:hypothetical protein
MLKRTAKNPSHWDTAFRARLTVGIFPQATEVVFALVNIWTNQPICNCCRSFDLRVIRIGRLLQYVFRAAVRVPDHLRK